MPNGKPIGKPGKSSGVRVIQGDVDDALDFFDEMVEVSGAVEKKGSTYKGRIYELPDGGTIAIRDYATRSPNAVATIDINVKGIPIRKIKFEP